MGDAISPLMAFLTHEWHLTGYCIMSAHIGKYG